MCGKGLVSEENEAKEAIFEAETLAEVKEPEVKEKEDVRLLAVRNLSAALGV